MNPARYRKTIIALLLLLLVAAFIHDEEGSGDGSHLAFTGTATAPVHDGTLVAPVAVPAPVPPMQVHAQGVFFDQRAVQAQVQQMAQASRPDAGPLQRVDIIDATGFAQPLPMFSVGLPGNWQHEYRVDWDTATHCPFNGPRVIVNADSADGLHGLAMLPGMGWQVSARRVDPNFPCPAAGMMMPRDYLEQVARQLRPGMRVLAFRERPDLANPQDNHPEYGGELLIAHSLQGVVMHETLLTTINHTSLARGGLLAVAGITLVVRAPDGQLDAGFVQQVVDSLQPGEEWGRHFNAWSAGQIQAWHEGRMSAIAMAGAAARHRINMDTIAEIGRLNTEAFNTRMASNERTNAAFIDAIREVQPWRDPASGQQVDLPMHYQHAWQLSDGRQFLTNDPNFEPYRDLGIAGDPMQPVR